MNPLQVQRKKGEEKIQPRTKLGEPKPKPKAQMLPVGPGLRHFCTALHSSPQGLARALTELLAAPSVLFYLL